MDKRKYLLAFMMGLAVALSLSAAFTRSNVMQSMAAPLFNLNSRQNSNIEIMTSTYDISWYTIDGGGGVGTGGSYELKYTIGQPDFSLLSGSSYFLHGGFWPGIFQFFHHYLPILFR